MLRKHPYLEQLLQGIFLIALICLLGISLSLFHDIGGTARVINYAGIVRGCTQRVVKLELNGEVSEELMEYLDEILQELQHGYSFVFVDLDRLKFVNDTFGHEEGDRYICSVTELLRSQFRASDVMFRMGGDEFAVFLEECQESVAVQLLENVRKKVMADKSRGYEGSFSYGVVYVEPYAVRRARDILDESDRRMYEYKKAHNKERK